LNICNRKTGKTLNTEDFLSAAPTELPDKIKSGELSNEEFARNFAQFYWLINPLKSATKL
jgi:hypothetical protein